MIYDLIILGAGPAGITASVYAARKKMDFLVITKDIGGQTLWTADIENYIGYQFITGVELVDKFRDHLKQFNVKVNEGEEVKLVKKEADIVVIETNKGEYKTRAVIVATGRVPRKLEVEGEDEFIGRGITYCATCDAPLFAAKDVVVVGGGNSALDAVLQLAKIANKIYLVDIAESLLADSIMVEQAKASGKVTFYNNAKIEKVIGDDFVTGIKINQEGKEIDLAVGGVFIEIGSLPASNFINELEKNDFNEIIIDCQTKTNIEGIFAAGDVTDVYAKQIIIACGEGAKAALASYEYLTRTGKKVAAKADYWEA
jgi:alkyl hydroperoxide reductase subunit F